MGGMLKTLLKSLLDLAASLPSGLSPELPLPREELCQNSHERSASMNSNEEPTQSNNGFAKRAEEN
jgi:hypothetical protein